MVADSDDNFNLGMVKAYANDLKQLLNESEITDCKTFLKTFVKKIETDSRNVSLKYTLPLPGTNRRREVLPIDTFGGAGETISRTDTVSCLELSGGKGKV